MQYPRVLTIAGSDSGGGAGIQADIKAISATGSYAASAITAVTVQNTLGVEAVHPVPVDIISAQIDCVLSDIGADAIKIGMLHSAEVVLAVRDALLRNAACPAEGGAASLNIVLDPVMVATSGHRLIEESAVKVLTEELLPLARVITPNIPEAEILAGRVISSQEELPSVARELSKKASRVTPVSVLMKAGHLTDDRLVDVFYNAEEDRIVELPSARVYTQNTHGTGCTLSSAFASYLAQGLPLDDAARAATDYIHNAIVSGAEYTIGQGHGPVNHFWNRK
ncbi:MAG: bifunctional hydroxymethylpyrimidine kinase/phosphomethylpyrimidine kinase [Bacteroidales bacterium]|nr:bifunctional hydroxymethylpyrimidine kinase/phosphomethylpyrimidine kinase [Bacteroidales bacterium]